MTTRRSFIRKAGIGLFAAGTALAQTDQKRPSFLTMLFRQDATAPAPHRPDPAAWDSSTITAAWIGHATVLINMFGTIILTDPVFSERIGIRIPWVTTLGPQRLVAPALQAADMPHIDLLLLSHGHMDHLDFPSLRELDRKTPVIMAKNTSDLLTRRGWNDVRELDWGETLTIAGIEIEAIKVSHFGWRFPWEEDRSRGFWNGRSYNAYRISKNGRNILFGGDTAYQEEFASLGRRSLAIDLAIMPIGAYQPWIRVHANPEQALAMAKQMNARAIMPIHWNTFRLSYEPQREPIERMKAALAGETIRLAVDDIGQTWKL